MSAWYFSGTTANPAKAAMLVKSAADMPMGSERLSRGEPLRTRWLSVVVVTMAPALCPNVIMAQGG